jgi:hypothetical protein
MRIPFSLSSYWNWNPFLFLSSATFIHPPLLTWKIYVRTFMYRVLQAWSLVFVFGVVRLLSSWAVYKGVSLVLFVFIFPCPVYVILSWMCLIVAADVFLWKCRNCRLGFFLAAWISLSYSHLCHFNCGSSLIVFLVIKGCDKEG